MKKPPQPTDAELDVVLQRVDAECAAGRTWRAKELLRDAIRRHGYHPRLCQRLGNVLIDMNDTLAAGRMLFLSGTRVKESEEAIRVYLDRHGRSSGRLYASFPEWAQLATLDEYPPALAAELRALGVRPPAPSPGWVLYGCIGISSVAAVFLLSSLVVGTIEVVRWLLSWLG